MSDSNQRQPAAKRLSILKLMMVLLLVVPLAAGCDSGGGGDDEDTTPPVVSINQPTEASTYTVNTGSITIGGTASDNAGVDQVIWESSAGASGTASGTVSWEAQIDLSPGVNQITVTAVDKAGNTGTDTLAITLTSSTYSLSGTVTAASNTAIDSDVNDPNAPYAPNDTAEQAQIIPTPVTIGGYVNKPQTGDDGRSFLSGDVNDVFRVDLLTGEQIILNIAAQILEADLDLYLYDAASLNLIDSAVDWIARTESLVAPQAGTYLIQVITELGASNYTLTIGQAQGNGGKLSEHRLSADFVPGEVMIEFNDADMISAQRVEPLSSMGLSQIAGGPGRERLFKIQQDLFGSESLQSLSPAGQPKNSLLAGSSMDASTCKKLNTLLKIKALRSRPELAAADPNFIHRAFTTPNDEYYPLQWHYPLINLPEAWEISTGSQDVTVAVVDTGVIMNHPDLIGKITSDGYDFISDPDRAMDGDGIDANPNDPGDASQSGSSFHGTHVSGTVAAASNSGIGVSGVAWNSRIMAIRALGKGSTGSTYDILQGIRYAAGLANDSGTTPSSPADIINLSLGGGSFSQVEQNVLAQARNAGIIIVAAAGNSAEEAPSYPAAYDGVISVSAVDINATLAPYSNFGPTIDVAAPGGDFSTDLNADGYVDGVLSTGGDDSSGIVQNVYTFYQGTSMAAPHMAGVAALMKSVRPSLTPDDLEGFLQSGEIVRDIGAAGRDDFYGYGLIDARKAVLAARDGSVPTLLSVSPATLSLGSIISNVTITASRVGSDELSIINVTDDADWLTISTADTDANGLGTYTVTVDRRGLSDGIYNAVITFVSSENTVDVSVNMRISSTGLAPDAGFHYVLLVDNQTDETAAQVLVDGQDGSYAYQFTNIEPGTYRVYAGTDSDNDFEIGDAGEAIGAYLSTDQPTVLSIDSNRTGLDFVTEFKINIPDRDDAALATPLARGDGIFLKKAVK